MPIIDPPRASDLDINENQSILLAKRLDSSRSTDETVIHLRIVRLSASETDSTLRDFEGLVRFVGKNRDGRQCGVAGLTRSSPLLRWKPKPS